MNRPPVILLFLLLITAVMLPERMAIASGHKFVTTRTSVSHLKKATPEITTGNYVGLGAIRSCFGEASTDPYIGQFTVSGTALTDDIKLLANQYFELAVGPGNNFSTQVTIPHTAGSVNNVLVRVRSLATAPAGFISSFVALSSSGAQVTFVQLSGKIGNAATVDKMPPLTVTNGSVTQRLGLAGTGNFYNWTNDNPAIGLVASGKGVVPAFRAINTGTTPISATITVTPVALPLLKVVSRTNNTFTSINTSNDKVERSYTIWPEATSMAASPDGRRVYVVHGTLHGNIYGHDVATDTVYGVITAGTRANKVVVSPDGNTAYVTIPGGPTPNLPSNYVRPIYVASRQYGGGPITYTNIDLTGMAISADGRRLYLLSKGPDAVTLLNPSNSFDIKTIVTTGLVASPAAALCSADDTKLFVAGQGVSVISQATNTIIRNFGTDIKIGEIAVTIDGKTLYATEPSADRILKFDVNTGVQLAALPVGKTPIGIQLTADGRQLFVANTGETSVSVVDVASFTIDRNIATVGSPSLIALIDGTSCPGIPEQYTITVNPTPTLYKTGSPVALNTDYGTLSATTTFDISGTGIVGPINITSPAGFELSLDGVTFSNTLTISGSGTVPKHTIHARLLKSNDAGDYQGDIAINTLGAVNMTVPMPLSKVTPALLTLKANDRDKFYGETINTPALNSNAYTITAGGLKNGNTIMGVDIVFGTGRNATDDVGDYTQTIQIMEIYGDNGFVKSNYNITPYVKGDIKVTEATLSIKADDANKTYGSVLSNGTITTGFTATGLVSPETIGSVNVTYTDGAKAGAGVKNYQGAVTISGAAGGTFKPSNYIITGYIPGDVNVRPATITVTPANATRNPGQDNPVFAATYQGFVNNEDATVITTKATITTTATRNSPPGKYPIVAANARADNYSFNYIAAELTITGGGSSTAGLGIPNVITPNDDGINDTWTIKMLFGYPGCTVNIFARNGQAVFSSIGYPTPWDGKFLGRKLDAGTYYYVIKRSALDKPISGTVTLIR